MFIDKNELNLGDIKNFDNVKGLQCSVIINIEAVGNNDEVLTGKITSALPNHIIDKIKNQVIDYYKDELKNQLHTGQLHITYN